VYNPRSLYCIKVLTKRHQIHEIGRIWVRSLYDVVLDGEEDEDIPRALRRFNREFFGKNILFLIILSLFGERASQA